MLEIHVCNNEGKLLRAFALGDSNEVIVGRDDACDIRIVSRSVSREHCTIEREGDDLYLRDLGSTGGTYVDEERIDRVALREGMEFRVGPARLKIFDGEL